MLPIRNKSLETAIQKAGFKKKLIAYLAGIRAGWSRKNIFYSRRACQRAFPRWNKGMKVKIMSKVGFKIVDLNRRKAIHERCLNCSAWIPSEVSGCSFHACPLFWFRTGKEKQNPRERKEVIRKYCLWCMAGQSSAVSKCASTICSLYPYRRNQMDRSVEIVSKAEKVHIETIAETKTEKGIHWYG